MIFDISMSCKCITFHKIYLFYTINNFRNKTLTNKCRCSWFLKFGSWEDMIIIILFPSYILCTTCLYLYMTFIVCQKAPLMCQKTPNMIGLTCLNLSKKTDVKKVIGKQLHSVTTGCPMVATVILLLKYSPTISRHFKSRKNPIFEILNLVPYQGWETNFQENKEIYASWKYLSIWTFT